MPALTRCRTRDLELFAAGLLLAAGLPEERARDVAGVLVEADLLGHSTHGLALLPGYLDQINAGGMRTQGAPGVISTAAAAQVWDGKRLPGPWLVLRAAEAAAGMARDCGTGTVVIRNAHHIGCLAVYLRRAAEAGLMLIVMSSAPATRSVAPFGAREGVLSPNPIGAGFPAGGDPVLVDISTSTTANGVAAQLHREGRRLPAPWAVDEDGVLTDDPAAVLPPRKGAILPLGGPDSGHKGTGLSLMVEAMTSGLAGQGRKEGARPMAANVFVQMLEPERFAGRPAFEAEMAHLAAACRAAAPLPGVKAVRLPGERALVLRRLRQGSGVELAPAVLAALAPHAERLGVSLPEPVN